MVNYFWKKLLVPVTLATTLSGFSLSGFSLAVADEEAEAKMLTIGSKAPAIEIEHWVSDGNGKFQPIQEFEADKVYVVEFWATWCGPCIASMPHLAEIQTKYAPKGVTIISVSDEDLETVQGFLERPVRGGKPAKEGDEKEAAEANTYGKLTSVYCLTTDPDGSVKNDYMRAAGQNGIPTSFIVGKTGLVEWIGHPMSMDEPLAQVVSGEWDRDAFLEEFRKEQERDLLMAKLSQKMRRGDVEGALEILAAAKESAAGDEESLENIEQLVFRVKLSGAATLIQKGEVEDGIAGLDALYEAATAEQKTQVLTVKINVLLSKELYDEAATALTSLADSKEPDPMLLNQISWQIYETAAKDEEFSKTVVAAATKAAAKAAELDPQNGMILDTLAHLVYHQGDIEKAIEIQTKAVENIGEAAEAASGDMKAFLKQLKKEAAQK